MIIMIIIFCMSVSFDAMAVGFNYGINKIRIPFIVSVLVGIFSGISAGIARLAGLYFASFFTPDTSELIGIFIVITLGSWMAISSYFTKKKPHIYIPSEPETICDFFIKSLGISLTVTKHPNCDFNNSHTIEFKEGMYLGFLVSCDAFFSSIGFSMANNAPVYIAFFAGFFHFLFLIIGKSIGLKMSNLKFFQSKFTAIIPGCALVLIGLFELIMWFN